MCFAVCACVGWGVAGERIYENSVLATQFFSKPKTAFKNKAC